MDLNRLETRDGANAGSVMTVLDPQTFEPLLDDEGKEMWIRLAGEDSDVYQSTTLAVTDRRLQIAFEHRGGLRVHAAELENEALTRLAKCTIAWHVQVGGTTPPCTESEAKTLYKRFSWLRQQADQFLADRRHFFAPLNGH